MWKDLFSDNKNNYNFGGIPIFGWNATAKLLFNSYMNNWELLIAGNRLWL